MTYTNKLSLTHSLYLILETLKDEVSLYILKLLDLLLVLQLVILHRATHVMARLLRMEHVGTQVQHCLLVHDCVLSTRVLGLASDAQRARGTLCFFGTVVGGVERVLD